MVGTLLSARQAAAQQIRSAQGGAAPAQPAPAPAQPAQTPAPQPQATQPAAVARYRRRSRFGFAKTLAAMAAGVAVYVLWQHRNDYTIVKTARDVPEQPRTAMQVYHDSNAGVREVAYDGGVTMESVGDFFDSFGNMVRSATGAYSDVAAASARVKTVVASARADRAEEEARGAAANFRTAWDQLTLQDRRQGMRERSVRQDDAHRDRVQAREFRAADRAEARRRAEAADRARVNSNYQKLVQRTRNGG